MNIHVGAVVWIGIDAGVIQAGVLEIETHHGDLVRLRDTAGNIAIKSIEDLYDTEAEAVEARCAEAKFWRRRYTKLADECAESVLKMQRRLAQLEAKRVKVSVVRSEARERVAR